MPNVDMPPLAHYKPVGDYTPSFGDYVVWSGWFATWHGVVSLYDEPSGIMTIIFGGTPKLLFTLTPEEQKSETTTVTLSQVRSGWRGGWAFLKHDSQRNVNVWYV